MSIILRLSLCGWLLLFGFADLWASEDNGFPYGLPFEQSETPVYSFGEFKALTALKMDFSSSRIKNPEAWMRVRQRCKVNRVDLVFTQFPVDTSQWKRAYHHLLKDRLFSLFHLDPELNNKDLEWRLVLQTGCESSEEAKKYFHGFVIYYDVTDPEIMQAPSTLEDVEKLLNGKAVIKDSTVLKVMNRNRKWQNVLVVMDWTGSMYRYGAQVVIWHKLNLENSGLKHFVFFNDGDKKRNWQKELGRTGGIYYAASRDIYQIVETMGEVMNKGYGGDAPENDLEALMKSIQKLEGFDEVVLIADNKSPVRDLALLDNLKTPIRIVLCGAQSRKIHPDYLKIAFKTKGSIHTVEKDILEMAQLKEGDIIHIEGIRYKVRGGELELFR